MKGKHYLAFLLSIVWAPHVNSFLFSAGITGTHFLVRVVCTHPEHPSRFCGGSIIGFNWVLTAADCVDGSSEGDVWVEFGNYSNPNENFQTAAVDKIIQHGLFDHVTLYYNVAMLHVTDRFEQHHILTLCTEWGRQFTRCSLRSYCLSSKTLTFGPSVLHIHDTELTEQKSAHSKCSGQHICTNFWFFLEISEGQGYPLVELSTERGVQGCLYGISTSWIQYRESRYLSSSSRYSSFSSVPFFHGWIDHVLAFGSTF